MRLNVFASLWELYSEWWVQLWEKAPTHVIIETLLILVIGYILFIVKPKDPNKRTRLTEKEEEELLEEWEPQPLVPDEDPEDYVESKTTVITKVDGARVLVEPDIKWKLRDSEDVWKINMCSFDFLGMAANDSLKKKAVETMQVFTTGSCGPRGFLGTSQEHLNMEAKFAEFFGTEHCIAYSCAFTTSSSLIPAFSKRGDLLVVDKGVSLPILNGVNLSRSKVRFFEHNNMEELEDILKDVCKHKIGSTKQRRIIVTEGLYRDIGDVCDLPRLVELKLKYKFRLFCDESFSIGVLGDTGRGITEHFHMPFSSVDLLCGSCAHSFGTIGGFCVGSERIVDHQRISGNGYVFSAAAPAFMAACSVEALRHMEAHPEMLSQLREKASRFRGLLRDSPTSECGFEVRGADFSPVVHIVPSSAANNEAPLVGRERVAVENKLEALVQKCLRQDNLLFCWSKYTPDRINRPPPSLRVTVSVLHSNEDLEHAASVIKEAFRNF